VIFTEIRFLVLFAACWITFFAVPVRLRSAALALWSAAFYLIYAGSFFAAVISLIVATRLAERRAFAWAVAAVICALLVFYKLPANSVMIPLGFSYLSFELLHVIIERRRGRIDGIRLADLFGYALFLPCRVAGPIRRYPDFLAAVSAATFSTANVYSGFLRILIGLTKKLILADTLALTGMELGYVASPRHAWTIVLAYSVRIFLDFSAYSDVAIGLSRMLGIVVPENFSYPYFAPNIREFWRRWHITLSNWVRDYLFVPTGSALFRTRLRQSPAIIAVISYLVTFFIVGAWHGLSGAFLVWGVYHGALLSAHHVFREMMPHTVLSHRWYRSRLVSAASVFVTFIVVTLGWVPFMTDLETSRRLLALMFGVS
jgi:alginate O-acetyltransferase complex protein AlgI